MANVPIPNASGYQAQLGLVSDSLTNATINTDNQYIPPRLSRRGEVFTKVLYQSLHTLSNEGSLYVAQTATPGVGLTGTSSFVTFLDSCAMFGFNNLSSTLTVIPLSLQILVTVAGTAGTDSHIAGRLDSGAGISGGTQLTGKAGNPLYTNDGAAAIFAGQITVATATANVRRHGRAEVRKAAAPGYIVGDCITVLWGAVEEIQAQAITPTVATAIVVHMPTTEVPPGWCYALNEWMTARTAPQQWELVFQYVVR